MVAVYQVVIFATLLLLAASSGHANDLVDLTQYHVTTNVQSRLLETTIDMTFRRRDENNTATCGPVIHTMTLQLPRLARVQRLEMNLAGGCQLDSQVQGLEQAQDTFDNMASEGKPAALLTAWDMSNYKLQVVLPSVTTNDNSTSTTLVEQKPTTVRLIYTELLVQKNHQVDFQLPVFPGIAVSDSLKVDLTIQDSNAGIMELKFLNQDTANANLRKLMSNKFNVTQLDSKMTMAHFQESNLPEDSSIPRLVRGYFRPGSLPEMGVLTIPLLKEDEKEEVCFTHIFNPSDFLATAGSLPKNMVFVIDISGSMSGDRLENAKAAFASMVSALADNKDAFSVQTFSSEGTGTLWGPAMANPTSKQEATQFVQSLQANGGTNLHDAYLDGIGYARSMANDIGMAHAAVPILVVLSDGEASTGVTNRVVIARNVREANLEGTVKIFSLAFGSSADVDLLTGIALQNGGKVLRIYEGFDDTILQMEDFYKKELEQIVLSDIDISFFQNQDDSGVGAVNAVAAASLVPLSILDATSSSFPVLAGGSELVIRGKVARSDLPMDRSILQASISALSAVGKQDWSHQYDLSLPELDNDEDNNNNADTTPPLIANDCEQSFAHARIEELLNLRNAERVLGDDLATTTTTASVASTSVLSFEERAQKIAVDAQLVWPGLTALVTMEDPGCQQHQLAPQGGEGNESPVCYSGESEEHGDDYDGGEFENLVDKGAGGGSGGYSANSPVSAPGGPGVFADSTTGSRQSGGSPRLASGSTNLGGQMNSWWFMASSLVFMMLLFR